VPKRILGVVAVLVTCVPSFASAMDGSPKMGAPLLFQKTRGGSVRLTPRLDVKFGRLAHLKGADTDRFIFALASSTEASGGDLVDSTWDSIVGRVMTIELSDGQNVVGTILGYDSDIVSVEIDGGKIVEVHRSEIVGVSVPPEPGATLDSGTAAYDYRADPSLEGKPFRKVYGLSYLQLRNRLFLGAGLAFGSVALDIVGLAVLFTSVIAGAILVPAALGLLAASLAVGIPAIREVQRRSKVTAPVSRLGSGSRVATDWRSTAAKKSVPIFVVGF